MSTARIIERQPLALPEDWTAQEAAEHMGLRGFVETRLFTASGDLALHRIGKNLITFIGDQYYGERAAGIGTPPNQVTGMKLGTCGSTVVSKTGAGAGIVTYLSGSQRTMDGGVPTSANNSGSRRIQWKSTWAAGVATNSAINEAVITNQTALADNTSLEAVVKSRAAAVALGTINKGANDTLEITWSHDLLGS